MLRIVAFTILVGLLAVAGPVSGSKVYAVSITPNTVRTTDHFVATDTPTILVDPVQGPSVSKQLVARAKSSWPWYITRASGFVAAISLILLMLSGVGFITGASFKFLEPLTAWATHKAVAYVFGISIMVHGVALLFDKYVPFTIAQALVPFLSYYRPVVIAGRHLGSLYVALGIIAMYFVLAIILTSIFWIDKKPHTWKIFHILAYLTMIFVFFHALYIGTDLAHGIFRVLWIIAGVGVMIAILYRLKRIQRVK